MDRFNQRKFISLLLVVSRSVARLALRFVLGIFSPILKASHVYPSVKSSSPTITTNDRGDAMAETSCLSTRDSREAFFSGAFCRLFFISLLRFATQAFRGGGIVTKPVITESLVY